MTPPNAKLLSCREVDRMYRLGKGTASAAFKAKRIRGRKTGKTIWLSAKRAEELWGVPS